MAKDRIKVLGDWSAWDDHVRQGRLIRPDGEAIWILMQRLPNVEVAPSEWKTQKTHSRLISRIDHPSVLRLLHAVKIEGAPAWVYEGFQGVSLQRVLAVHGANGEYISARAALETVERTAQGLRAAIRQGAALGGTSNALFHPGPSPANLLIDAVGAVKLAGFALDSAAPTVDGYTPHELGTAEQRGSYGISALLVHLLGGECPGIAGTDPDRQNAVIRRALIRVLARPGEAVPEPVIDLIKAGLSHAPEDRPDLTTYEDVLAEAANQLRSPSLRVWAPTAVPDLLKMQDGGFPEPDSQRARRHIDLSEDSSSYEVPPLRPRATGAAPREVATVMAKVDVAAAIEAASEDGSRDSFGAVSQTSFAAVPTSETDVKLASAKIRIPEGSSPAPVPMDIDGPDDTWEIEPAVEGRMGGWPLVAGLLIGMVVAAFVGWIVVEQMGKDLPLSAEAEPTPPVLTIPSTASAYESTDKDEQGQASEDDKSGASGQDVAKPSGQDAGQPRVAADEESKSAALHTLQVAPPVEARTTPPSPGIAEASGSDAEQPDEAVAESPEPTPIETAGLEDLTSGEPESDEPTSEELGADQPASEAPASEEPASEAPVDEGFTVRFQNVSLDMERMVVKCHQGTSTTLDDDVIQVSQAGKGPCRVEAGLNGERMVVSVILKGPQEYRCFEDNARMCR